MAKSFAQNLYCHLIWATWNRLPLIDFEIESSLYPIIISKARELGAETIAIGGTCDHIHLLVRFHPTLSIAGLAKGVKGASSHFVTHNFEEVEFFKWQTGYSAFTVNKESLSKLVPYIRNQKLHHRNKCLNSDMESDSNI